MIAKVSNTCPFIRVGFKDTTHKTLGQTAERRRVE